MDNVHCTVHVVICFCCIATVNSINSWSLLNTETFFLVEWDCDKTVTVVQEKHIQIRTQNDGLCITKGKTYPVKYGNKFLDATVLAIGAFICTDTRHRFLSPSFPRVIFPLQIPLTQKNLYKNDVSKSLLYHIFSLAKVEDDFRSFM